MSGTLIPFTDEIAWAVAVDGSTLNNKILFYNTKTGQWRHENKAARVLDIWQLMSTMTWDDLVVLTDDEWPSAKSWAYYINESSKLVFDDNAGNVFSSTSEGDNASNWDGYRIEPVLPLPNQYNHRLLEIWLSVAEQVNASIDFYWRGGDTVAEVEQEPWTSLGSISMNKPSNPVLYTDKTARLHQIKWGTDLKSEPFSVNDIKVGFVSQGKY